MNDNLRKNINVRNMLQRKYKKCKSTEKWKAYRNHRNLVTKLRKKSIGEYLKNNCKVSEGKQFWNTIKPLISDKSKGNNTDIALFEDDKIVNQAIDVANAFNEYFVNVTKEIGKDDMIQENDTIRDIIDEHNNHSSINFIKQHHLGKVIAVKMV